MTTVAYSTEKKYDGFMRINSCGKRDLRDKEYDTFRPNGRIDYSLQYIRTGLCYAEIDGRMQRVEEGSLILYFPEVSQHYVFREQDSSQLMWSHFSGTSCNVLEPLRSDKAVIIKIRDRHEFERNFEKLLASHYHREPCGEELSQGYMQVLLALMLKSGKPVEEKSQPIHEGLDKVLSHMYVNYNAPIDLDFYARMCYVSKNRFIHLFKAYTGMPPYRYQLKIRLDWARELLENTPISVNECAQTVGFSDVSYFCRVFKKFNGHPPAYYKS